MSLIEKLSTKRYVILLSILFLTALAFMQIILTPRIEEMSGHMGSLDMMHSYSVGQVYNLLDILGSSGRRLYIIFLATDLIFISTFLLLQMILFSFLIHKAKLNPNWQLLNLFPVLRAICDLLENIFIVRMIVSYPRRLDLIAGISSRVTSIKWIAMVFIVIAALILAILAIKNHRKVSETV